MGLLYSNYECNPVTNNSLKINAVSGTLTKTYKDSYFVRFEKDSSIEHFYFRESKPSRIVYYRRANGNYKAEDEEEYNDKYFSLKEIVVLQVMLCSDDNYLVEAIDKEDYDKMFGLEKSDKDEKHN